MLCFGFFYLLIRHFKNLWQNLFLRHTEVSTVTLGTKLLSKAGASPPSSGKRGNGLGGWQFRGERVFVLVCVRLVLTVGLEKIFHFIMKSIKTQEYLCARLKYVASSDLWKCLWWFSQKFHLNLKGTQLLDLTCKCIKIAVYQFIQGFIR